jgi:murein hydrolase activator
MHTPSRTPLQRPGRPRQRPPGRPEYGRATACTRFGLCAILLCAAGFGTASTATAQQDVQRSIRDSQLRLDSIREERARLQRELNQLQSRVRDASRELQNIGSQRAASVSALHELEFQSEMLNERIEETSESLTATRARLRVRTNELNQRLRSIYKRGRMHALRVLLSAENFSDLLNRYKYLHMMTLYERRMLEDVGRLERELTEQEQSLRQTLGQLDGLRMEKQNEVAALQRLETQHNRALRDYQQQQTRTTGALEQLTRDEALIANIIRDLERRRLEEARRAEASGRPTAPGAISTRSVGSLAWPVDGDIIYRFGPERRANNVVLRHNGIGIAAPVGTPVRAVEAGTVTLARPFEGYGPTVMLSHGGGYYTLYLYLSTVSVREGQGVSANQTIGTVGGERTAEGPHLEFRVLVPLQGGPPQPVDPLDWLRARAGR